MNFSKASCESLDKARAPKCKSCQNSRALQSPAADLRTNLQTRLRGGWMLKQQGAKELYATDIHVQASMREPREISHQVLDLHDSH